MGRARVARWRRRVLLPSLAAALLGALLVSPVSAATRSVSLSVAPGTLLLHDTVTATGVVRGVSRGTRVTLQRWDGSRWRTSASARTGAGGRFTARPVAVTSGRVAYRARIAAVGSRRPAVASVVRRVSVLRRSGMTLVTSRPDEHARDLDLRGTVSAARAGAPVRADLLVDGTWRTLDSGLVGTSGSFALDVQLPWGASSVRVVAPRDGYRASATSGVRSFVTTPVAAPDPEPTPDPDPGPTPDPGPDPDPSPGPPPVVEVQGSLDDDTTWRAGTEVRLVGDVDVAAGVTLTVEGGTTVRSEGHRLAVRGRLVTTGSGVTVLGPATQVPSAGDWPGVVVEDGGSADLGTALVTGASTALAVERGGTATWRGSVRVSTLGLDADGFVDARGVDWGSATGPAPWGTGVPVRGYGAQVLPWAGFEPGAEVPSPVEAAAPVPCADVVLLGARGSGEAPRGSDPYEEAPAGGLGAVNVTVLVGVHDAILAARPGTTVSVAPVRYAAAGFPPGDATSDWPRFEASLRQGADDVAATVADLAQRCPESLVVATGTSQGAAVVHAGLVQLTSEQRSRVAAVGLLGDMATSSTGDETFWRTSGTPGPRPTTGGVVPLRLVRPSLPGVLPADLAPRTISLCHTGDVVCDAAPGAGIERHLDYSSQETYGLGVALAEKVLERLPQP